MTALSGAHALQCRHSETIIGAVNCRHATLLPCASWSAWLCWARKRRNERPARVTTRRRGAWRPRARIKNPTHPRGRLPRGRRRPRRTPRRIFRVLWQRLRIVLEGKGRIQLHMLKVTGQQRIGRSDLRSAARSAQSRACTVRSVQTVRGAKARPECWPKIRPSP
eukprot:COSAG02_NODE_8721_length_2462_cov_6.146037_2_plen_165_part_00